MNTTILSSESIVRATGFYEKLRNTTPKNRADLNNYLRVFLNLNISDTKICPEHNTPMDYLWHCYSEPSTTGDCIVWAPRGGGKTLIAAVATLLFAAFDFGRRCPFDM